MNKWNVGILIFQDAEVLDFAGPYEVFSRTRRSPGVDSRHSEESAPFVVFTVAKTEAPIVATGGLTVTPDFSFDNTPSIDILVIPGGFGTRPLMKDEETLSWIREVAGKAQKTTSVCTGSLLLAKAGLLECRRATTHWAAQDLLESLSANISVQRGVRFVDDGIITSAGVSAGIDMAFYVIETLLGSGVAEETAHYIDYLRR